MGKVEAVNLLSAQTTTGAGSTHHVWGSKKTFQAQGTTSSGSGAATLQVQGSNDGNVWKDLVELILTLETTLGAGVHGFYEDTNPWKYIRGNVSAISGAGASVDLLMGNVPRGD